jgi:hypothetical protein
MVAYHACNTDDRIDLKIMQGTLIQNQRAELALDAMREGCSHILFIDSDMTFPQDMIQRLMAHDLDIVATNCARRRMPTGPTAKVGNKLIYSTLEDHGLQEVDTIGMGVMLIKADVFKKMSEPWFETPWRTDKRGYVGEDVFFCLKAKEIGYKIYIDHDVSREIGHVGTFEFRHEHTWVVKDLQDKEA